MKKEEIINSISNRITAELHKHPQLDWADIAARKIYAEHLVKNNVGLDGVRLCFPTDEDIEDIAEATIKESGDNNDIGYWERIGFMDGAKWMREMVKNTKKWK